MSVDVDESMTPVAPDESNPAQPPADIWGDPYCPDPYFPDPYA
jgi:hypothetical protein